MCAHMHTCVHIYMYRTYTLFPGEREPKIYPGHSQGLSPQPPRSASTPFQVQACQPPNSRPASGDLISLKPSKPHTHLHRYKVSCFRWCRGASVALLLRSECGAPRTIDVLSPSTDAFHIRRGFLTGRSKRKLRKCMFIGLLHTRGGVADRLMIRAHAVSQAPQTGDP